MSLLRFAGRVLFSSYFVADGYKLLTKPDQHADEVGATIDKVVPLMQSVLPPDAADRVPEDARTWARLLGITQIVGGLAYATGIGRRGGAWALTAAAVPRVVAATGDRDDLSGLLNKAALLGAGIVATQDTAGRPGLAWRAEQSRKAIGSRVQATGKDLSKTQKKLGRTARQAELTAAKAARKARRELEGALN